MIGLAEKQSNQLSEIIERNLTVLLSSSFLVQLGIFYSFEMTNENFIGKIEFGINMLDG
jgi:hypothetical protein